MYKTPWDVPIKERCEYCVYSKKTCQRTCFKGIEYFLEEEERQKRGTLIEVLYSGCVVAALLVLIYFTLILFA